MTPITAAKHWATVPVSDLPPDNVIFGTSVDMRIIAERIDRIAKVNVPVLIHGESGTGREVIAKVIHLRSSFATGSFVRLNCVGASRVTLEHVFADPALVQRLDESRPDVGRTVFLDEVGELEGELQALLLVLLGNQKGVASASTQRIICATTRDLRKHVEQRTFRSDLLYRIDGVKLRIPPLRERIQDIPAIADYLLQLHSTRLNLPPRRFSPAVLDQMAHYRFPGNIRELENLTMCYAVLGDETEILAAIRDTDVVEFALDLAELSRKPLKDAIRHTVEQLENTIIRATLARNGWNRRRTADQLEISYRSLLYKIRAYGIPHLRLHRTHNANSA
jgi:two-component system, NtrC family, response regulator AtoC